MQLLHPSEALTCSRLAAVLTRALGAGGAIRRSVSCLVSAVVAAPHWIAEG